MFAKIKNNLIKQNKKIRTKINLPLHFKKSSFSLLILFARIKANLMYYFANEQAFP
jgi:hypothetical protein